LKRNWPEELNDTRERSKMEKHLKKIEGGKCKDQQPEQEAQWIKLEPIKRTKVEPGIGGVCPGCQSKITSFNMEDRIYFDKGELMQFVCPQCLCPLEGRKTMLQTASEMPKGNAAMLVRSAMGLKPEIVK
jgi:hypothetical protein